MFCFPYASHVAPPLSGRDFIMHRCKAGTQTRPEKGASYLRLFLYVKYLAEARLLVCMNAASSDSLPVLTAAIELKNLNLVRLNGLRTGKKSWRFRHIQDDTSARLKPPVDLDLGCSAILPGQKAATVVARQLLELSEPSQREVFYRANVSPCR